MAYTIRYCGYDVKCDTAADVRALVAQDKPSPAAIPRKQADTPPPTPKGWPGLVANVTDQQKKLLRAVANNGALSDDKLRDQLKLKNNFQLRGLLTGVARRAKNLNLKSPIEKTIQRTSPKGPRTYEYMLNESAKVEIQKALGG